MPTIYGETNAAAVTPASLSVIFFRISHHAGDEAAAAAQRRRPYHRRAAHPSGTRGPIPQSTVDGRRFVSGIAPTFIGSNVGGRFKREVIRSTEPRILIVTLFEALLSGVAVSLATRLPFGPGAEEGRGECGRSSCRRCEALPPFRRARAEGFRRLGYSDPRAAATADSAWPSRCCRTS